MAEHEYDVDLLVIGSGPGGQKAAIAAAKLGKRVCVVERRHMVGGVCVNTGTIPSKTLREAVLYLSGTSMRELYGASYRVKQDITVQDLLARTQQVIGREIEVVRAQLFRNHVELVSGSARFIDDHTVAVDGVDRGERSIISADKIVIATGTKPARPSEVDFDGRYVLDSDGILRAGEGAGLHGRRRRRGDRHRVRLDVRGARARGSRWSRSGRRCSSSATPRSSSR